MSSLLRCSIIWILLCGSFVGSWAGFNGGIRMQLYANTVTSLSIPAATNTTAITWRVEIAGSRGYPGTLSLQRSTSQLGPWTEVTTIPTNGYIGQINSTETNAHVPDTPGTYYFKAVAGLITPPGGTQDSDIVTITVVAIDRLKYDSGGGNYVDVPNPFYVAKGTSITFEAIRNPTGASWPAGKPVWGGTAIAGSTPPATTKTVTFNTVGSFTLTAECGNTVTVNITVWDFIIEKCEASWIPSKDGTTTITATLVPDTVTGSIKFTLYDVSTELGYCVNKGDQNDNDLKFQNQTGFTISEGNTVATKGAAANSATVTVTCYDYGAYGKIKAEGTVNAVALTAHVASETTQFVKIPRDDDSNDIADAWTHNAGGKGDDADTSANNTQNGDGLTRYEEYRGVDIDNNNAIAAAERLDPGKKDLFVKGSGFTGSDYTLSYGGAFTEAQINVHTFVGTVSADERGIDVMVVALLIPSGGHIIRKGDPVGGVRQWTWDTLGQCVPGTGTAYGSPNINHTAFEFYFSDKPYVDGTTWTAASTWGNGPNGIFDPFEKVEDTDDDGVLDANENNSDVSAPADDNDGNIDGDYPKKDGDSWDFYQDFSPHDLDKDGLVEVEPGSAREYSKAHIVMQVITHEMGHGVGISGPIGGHCEDNTCLMFKNVENRDRHGHFCNDCRGMILIHNN